MNNPLITDHHIEAIITRSGLAFEAGLNNLCRTGMLSQLQVIEAVLAIPKSQLRLVLRGPEIGDEGMDLSIRIADHQGQLIFGGTGLWATERHLIDGPSELAAAPACLIISTFLVTKCQQRNSPRVI